MQSCVTCTESLSQHSKRFVRGVQSKKCYGTHFKVVLCAMWYTSSDGCYIKSPKNHCLVTCEYIRFEVIWFQKVFFLLFFRILIYRMCRFTLKPQIVDPSIKFGYISDFSPLFDNLNFDQVLWLSDFIKGFFGGILPLCRTLKPKHVVNQI